LAPGARLADVACGPGTASIPAARRGLRVSALDFSPRMLEQLRARAAAEGVDGRIDVVEGDGQALPWADASFEAAISIFGLMFFPDRARGFAELFRVLAPGGVALVASWRPAAESPLLGMMFGALQAADPAMPGPERNPFNLENVDVFERELGAAGFVDLEVVPHTLEVDVPDAEAFWEKMTRSAAPLLLMRNRMGEEEWGRRAQLSRAWLQEQFAAGPRRLATTALFGSGRKPG
ncbi:MAG TPA: methyltransferase domain-containing protein, partial [Polyangiaceae bacterium]|nr:methyltransferase domain-containing protein [Polyangiaceae bacterium]